jgi:DNA-binding PadR family transcriptional regulator
MLELTRKEEQILLAIHSLRDDASLINIRERIHRYTGKNYSVGTVYAPLNRLHINGFLDSRLEKVAESKKPVRYYQLTEQGYKALALLKKQTDEMWEGFVNPILKKSETR